MGGGTGGGGGGTGPPQIFQRLTLCLWTLHGKNRLQMVHVPLPPIAAPWRRPCQLLLRDNMSFHLILSFVPFLMCD